MAGSQRKVIDGLFSRPRLFEKHMSIATGRFLQKAGNFKISFEELPPCRLKNIYAGPPQWLDGLIQAAEAS